MVGTIQPLADMGEFYNEKKKEQINTFYASTKRVTPDL